MSSRLARILLAGVTLAATGWTVSAQRPYRPVTDAMLLDPAPGDWINWRRTLNGWGYSPLNQINAKNVDQLQLVWSWALSSAGRPEPNPLVHDGVMYVASPFGIVEALDAVTGDRLWEYGRTSTSRNPAAS